MKCAAWKCKKQFSRSLARLHVGRDIIPSFLMTCLMISLGPGYLKTERASVRASELSASESGATFIRHWHLIVYLSFHGENGREGTGLLQDLCDFSKERACL